MRLRAILEDRDGGTTGGRADRLQIRRLTVEMDGDDRADAPTLAPARVEDVPDPTRIHAVAGIGIDQDGYGTDHLDRRHRRHRRVRDRDHPIPRPHAEAE